MGIGREKRFRHGGKPTRRLLLSRRAGRCLGHRRRASILISRDLPTLTACARRALLRALMAHEARNTAAPAIGRAHISMPSGSRFSFPEAAAHAFDAKL